MIPHRGNLTCTIANATNNGDEQENGNEWNKRMK
jgi:hypothetical protein